MEKICFQKTKTSYRLMAKKVFGFFKKKYLSQKKKGLETVRFWKRTLLALPTYKTYFADFPPPPRYYIKKPQFIHFHKGRLKGGIVPVPPLQCIDTVVPFKANVWWNTQIFKYEKKKKKVSDKEG